MNNKLPVKEIFLEALTLPQKYYRELFKAALPLIIVAILSRILIETVVLTEQNKIFILVIGAILGLLFIISIIIAIISCHRIFLMEDKEIKKFNWTGNEIKYIGWWFLIGLVAMLVGIPLALISGPALMFFTESLIENQSLILILLALFNIPLYYFISRWSLVLPSCAIDIHGKSLTWSWRLSKGNGWRLALLVGILPMLVHATTEFLPNYDSILLSLFYTFLWLFVGAIEVGLLSLSYQYLVNNEMKEETIQND